MAAMNKPNDSFSSNRRTFIKKTTGAVTATSALAGVTIPRVHASMDDFTKVALVGAGGRGTGAAANALSVPEDIARTKLVSMADVSTAKMENSFRALKRRGKDRVDVPEDRRYIGFDGYAKAMDNLRRRRRGHLHHPVRLPLGALQESDRARPERVHGKTGLPGRHHRQAHARPQ